MIHYKFSPSWTILYRQTLADLKLWGYFWLLQQLGRLGFIVVLSQYLSSESSWSDLGLTMLHGGRFDALWATCGTLPCLIFGTIPSSLLAIPQRNQNQNLEIWANRWRRTIGGVFTLLITLLYLSSIEYFREFRDIFNQMLFGWFYDDKVAIFKTIIAEHHLWQNLIVGAMILALYIWGSHNLKNNCAVLRNTNSSTIFQQHYRPLFRLVFLILLGSFYLIGFRGGIGPRPIQLKDAGVTTDSFLNQAIVSPASALKYAIKEYLATQHAFRNKFFKSSKSLYQDFLLYFGSLSTTKPLSTALIQHAPGNTLPKPHHIFLIVGESLDAWPLQTAYAKLQLNPQLQKLIKQGIYFPHFLPCAYSTIAALNTLLTGLPDLDLHLNYRTPSNTPYPTSLAIQLRRLGFKTRFFYGGYLSWQRLESFARSQGFEEVYGAPHIATWSKTNEWGVADHELFDFVLKKSTIEEFPTFNIIMTTSNHPPYSIDLTRVGFPQKQLLQQLTKFSTNATSIRELGHIWYGDYAIGKFVKQMRNQDSTSLFLITGDHYGRKHILPYPPMFEQTAVPLIIYSPQLSEDKRMIYQRLAAITAGSHLDLGATLIELIAPRNFSYATLGENLLNPKRHHVAFSKDRILTPQFIADTPSQKFDHFHSKFSIIATAKMVAQLQIRFQQLLHITHYLVQSKEAINAQPSPPYPQ